MDDNEKIMREGGVIDGDQLAQDLQEQLAKNMMETNPSPAELRERYRDYVEEFVHDPDELKIYNESGLVRKIPFSLILRKLIREGKIKDLGPLKGHFENDSDVIYYNNGYHDVLEANKYNVAEFDVCTIPNIVGIAYIDNDKGTREMIKTSLQDLITQQ